MHDSSAMKTKIPLCHAVNTKTSESNFIYSEIIWVRRLKFLDLAGPNCHGQAYGIHNRKVFKSMKIIPSG